MTAAPESPLAAALSAATLLFFSLSALAASAAWIAARFSADLCRVPRAAPKPRTGMAIRGAKPPTIPPTTDPVSAVAAVLTGFAALGAGGALTGLAALGLLGGAAGAGFTLAGLGSFTALTFAGFAAGAGAGAGAGASLTLAARPLGLALTGSGSK